MGFGEAISDLLQAFSSFTCPVPFLKIKMIIFIFLHIKIVFLKFHDKQQINLWRVHCIHSTEIIFCWWIFLRNKKTKNNEKKYNWFLWKKIEIWKRINFNLEKIGFFSSCYRLIPRVPMGFPKKIQSVWPAIVYIYSNI